MLEFYVHQEENDSCFTHNGQIYNLNKALVIASDKPITYLQVIDLRWILLHTKVYEDRISKAELHAPLLVTKESGKLIVLDGAHRLSKAVREGVDILPTRFLTFEELSRAV